MVLRPTFACLVAALLLLPLAALAGTSDSSGMTHCTGGISLSISPSPQLPGQPVTISSTVQTPASAGTYTATLCYMHGKVVTLPPSSGAYNSPVQRVSSGFLGTFTLRSDICDLVAQHGTITVVLLDNGSGLGGVNLNPVCLTLKKVPTATPTPGGGAPHPQ